MWLWFALDFWNGSRPTRLRIIVLKKARFVTRVFRSCCCNAFLRAVAAFCATWKLESCSCHKCSLCVKKWRTYELDVSMFKLTSNVHVPRVRITHCKHGRMVDTLPWVACFACRLIGDGTQNSLHLTGKMEGSELTLRCTNAARAHRQHLYYLTLFLRWYQFVDALH